MAGLPPSTLVEDLIVTLKSNSFDKMNICVNDVLAEGFSVVNILSQLFEKVSISAFISKLDSLWPGWLT